MNLMLLASVAVILLCALIGYRRGLIKSAVSAVGIVGAVILTNVLNPYVNQFLCQHTPLRDTVRQKVEQSIGVEDISESVSVYEKEDYLEHTELPEIVKNYIRSNGGDKINGKAIGDYVAYVVDYLTDMVMNGLSYLLTIFVVLLLVLIALACSVGYPRGRWTGQSRRTCFWCCTGCVVYMDRNGSHNVFVSILSGFADAGNGTRQQGSHISVR